MYFAFMFACMCIVTNKYVPPVAVSVVLGPSPLPASLVPAPVPVSLGVVKGGNGLSVVEYPPFEVG